MGIASASESASAETAMAAGRSAALLLLACCVATSFVAHGFPREEGGHDAEQHEQHQVLVNTPAEPAQASVENAQFQTHEDNWEEQLVHSQTPAGHTAHAEMQHQSLFTPKELDTKAARVVDHHLEQTTASSQRENSAKHFGTFAKQADAQGIVDEPPQLGHKPEVFPQARRRSHFKVGSNVVHEEAAQPKPAANPVEVYHPVRADSAGGMHPVRTQTNTPVQKPTIEQHEPREPNAVHANGKFPRFVPNTPNSAQSEPSFKRAEPAFKKAEPKAKSSADSSDEGNTTTMWIAIAISVVLLILAMFLCWFCLQKEEQEKKKGTQKLVDDDGQPNVEEDTDPNAWTNRNSVGMNDQDTPWYLRDETGKINFAKPQFTKSANKPTKSATTTGDANASSASEGSSNANSDANDANSAKLKEEKEKESANSGKVTFSK